MVHKYKPIALILLALVTLGITGVPSGSAESTSAQFTANQYPETVYGEAASGVTTFVTEAGATECKDTYDGELRERSQTLLLKQSTTACKVFGFLFGSVTSEGCGYLYHITTKVAADKFQAHVDLTCPEGQSIKLVGGACKAELKPQTGLTTVDFENMTTTPGSLNDLTMTDTVSGIAYTVTQDGIGCPFLGTGNKTGGTFTSSLPTTLVGLINGGRQEGLDIG